VLHYLATMTGSCFYLATMTGSCFTTWPP
jgi:hypothetical protein